MSTPPPGTLRELSQARRERAQAEAREWTAMVTFRDNALTRLRRDASPMRQGLERMAIHLQIARELQMSEGQVVHRLASADRAIEHGPRTWAAFQAGHIDAVRVREISLTIEKLERDDSIQRLDDEAAPYAREHTVTELRRWLRRFVARVEADLFTERANAERAKRHVVVDHTDDGMAWLHAYLPSHHAAAIQKRLQRTATAMKATDKADGIDRTHEQRRADLLTHLLTSAPADELPAAVGLRCDVAVMIDASVLTGAVEGPAEAADGSWQVPTDWLLHSAFAGDAFWHRMLLHPITKDVLAHEYAGYSPPAVLRRALAFRSGTCATPGCLVPADECELDHVIPWPEGRTTGLNLKHRCKRDHARKGHGILLELLDRESDLPKPAFAVEFVHAA
ncbi:HNH endonuclease signature motif containing protein [Aeromicrobium sp. Leaf350]|uniref:HNH endonuclease signature motif containing protein n=1 Tax=Aeromicrobium sp. Leaf350 TaxID=2876565 RepID=UPI001E30A75B|nr:HNH endonuclease signature motif containing protein [Aeromicrobium sp. Leaf350]